MTTTIHRASCTILALAAVLLAIALAPGRAFAHEAIPGTTGAGSQDDPVVISENIDDWTQFKAALELEENLYIKVNANVGNSTLPKPDSSFGSGKPLITIPEGYAKDIELTNSAGVHYARVDANTGMYDPFRCMILNQGTLVVHSEVGAPLSAKSSFSNYSVIQNEGNLYFYGGAGADASFADDDHYGATYGRGVYCASDDAVLVINGGTFEGAGRGFNDNDDVAAGVFVKKAKQVDILGGRFKYDDSVNNVDWYSAGFAVSDQLLPFTVQLHSGEFQRFAVTSAANTSNVKFEDYFGNTSFGDGFDGSGAEVVRDSSESIVVFRKTNTGKSVFNLTTKDEWYTDAGISYIGFRNLHNFVAGDGVTYGVAFSPNTTVAIDYDSSDPTVVMASAPTWPVGGFPIEMVKIGNGAFSGNWDISEVVLPDYLQVIGENAFSGSTLSKLTFGDAGYLERIGPGAFAGTLLKSISIPDSVEVIEARAFEDSKLEKVIIPVQKDDKTLLIADDAFLGSHLKEISCMNGGDIDLFPHSYGFHVNDQGDYVRNEPFTVHATPDTPFWTDAVYKGFIHDLRKATVEPIPDQEYNLLGEVKPSPVVKVSNIDGVVTLIEGKDYTVSYSNNTKLGTAKVDIVAAGDNYGGISATFKIVPAKITEVSTEKPSYTYTGKPIEPALIVYAGAPYLSSKDYDATYENNVKVGTATVTVKGKGNYTGTKSTTFKIVAADPTPDPTPGSVSWKRIAGKNALETMSAIVDEGGFAVGGTVVLASLEGYWDALTAEGIAGLEDAPVLMVLPDSVPAQTADQIKKLKPAKIIVCGGVYWIPDDVVKQAADLAGVPMSAVKRLAGDNAAQTAAKIAAEGKGKWGVTAIVATAGTFQDALAAAPMAYASAVPIFLAQFDFATEKGFIDKSTIDAMIETGITQCYIVGGEYWLPKAVSDDLEKAGIIVVKQLGGATAVETSGLIAQLALDEYGMSADKMGVADVRAHYDALASAALCGKNSSVLVLTLNEKSSVIDGFVKSHKDVISDAYIFGGTSSVSEGTEAALKDATK